MKIKEAKLRKIIREEIANSKKKNEVRSYETDWDEPGYDDLSYHQEAGYSEARTEEYENQLDQFGKGYYGGSSTLDDMKSDLEMEEPEMYWDIMDHDPDLMDYVFGKYAVHAHLPMGPR